MRKFYTLIAMMFATATAMATTATTLPLDGGQKVTAKEGIALPPVSDIISTQPEGTLYKNMSRSCNGFDYGIERKYDSYAGDIVVSADGKKLYMKNPMLCFSTGWIVGDLDAEGNVEFKFPQVIYNQTQDASGAAYELTGYAWKMINDTENKKFMLDEASQTVKFKWADNKLTQVNPDDVIGMGNESGTWMGYATWENQFSVITATPVQPAASLKATTYTMTYVDPVSDNASEGEQTGTSEVSVIFDGSDVYLGKFYTNCWIKGTLAGNKITFPARQYLGMESLGENINLHEYMLAFTMSEDQTTSTLADNLVFDYNAETGDMSTEQTFMVNVGTSSYLPLAGFERPKLKNSGFVAAKPAAPMIFNLEYNPSQNITAVAYANSNLSEDGKEMNKKNIFYNIYLDGELQTFTPSVYNYLKADMTDIPYQFYDIDHKQNSGAVGYDFMIYQDLQFVYFYKEFNKIGIKAVYVDGDTRIESDITERFTSGIDNARSEGKTVESITYTDMSGRRVAEPEKGIFVQTIKYTDGEVKAVKVVK